MRLAVIVIVALALQAVTPAGDQGRLAGFVSEYQVARGDTWTSIGARRGGRVDARRAQRPLGGHAPP